MVRNVGLPGTWIEVADFVTVDSDRGRGAALQAALDSVPGSGARVVLPPFDHELPDGGLTCTNPVFLEGVPGLDGSGSRLISTSAGGSALTLTAPASGLDGISIVNGNSDASDDLTGLTLRHADFDRVTRCLFDRFPVGCRIEGGIEYSVSETAFRAFTVAGLQISNSADSDSGDMTVFANSFDRGSSTSSGGVGLLWRSGGGLRFHNNKINGTPAAPLAHGLRMDIADGAKTGIVSVIGNSIENYRGDGIGIVRSSGDGVFGLGINIVGNILCPYDSDDDTTGIRIDAPAINVVVSANSVHQSRIGISIDGVTAATIAPNSLTAIGSVALRVGDRVRNVQTHAQTIDLLDGATDFRFDNADEVHRH